MSLNHCIFLCDISDTSTVANPNYERGPDPVLKLKYPSLEAKAEQNSSLTKQLSIYQPLVQNTRPRCLTAPTLCQVQDLSIGNGTSFDAGDYASLNKHTMDKYGLDSRPVSTVHLYRILCKAS